MTTLLRDVIDIPEQAGAEDYVLRLTDSVGHEQATRTLDEYVVTDDLAGAFDAALGLVAEAVGSGVSRGAFLAGSFGSGKSHFMAVLHALLRREPVARAKAELQQVVAKHDPALSERNILPLAFHLLGATSMEQALFQGYLRQIRLLHPGAPLPAVQKSDALLDDAEGLRTTVGDEAFFAMLNGDSTGGGPGGDDQWAAVLGTGTWDLGRYDEARAAEATSESRQRLVTALVSSVFTSYTDQADYVDLDTGLAAIATHAKGLGYDAVVLFLDELVLWLAFNVQAKEVFARESQKLTKLVESAVGGRAIPLVSFVARQMDLRRWFADAGASGAEQEALDRAFRHQEGRFGVITLGDDNLPYVASRRLLQPKDDQARSALEAAFTRIDRQPAVWDVLLDGVNTDERHRGADEAAFRLTYPFSPALVSTLRSLASVMQRERTALKVMQQILVERRTTLSIDEVIPVGDSFDYVVKGQTGQALDPQAAALFRSANKLYTEKLRPLLLDKHALDEPAACGDPSAVPAPFRADDRLAKTLLLSAVAPNVPALKSLTANRLAALNHGSIVSPLPGGEAALVLGKIRSWARDVPEIHIEGDDRNPTIRVQLSDVDYESVVERAKGEDNDGRRRELLKEIVADQLGVQLGAQDMASAYRHQLVWRGSRRQVDIVFGNVRDRSWLSDDAFRNTPDTWRVVVDHPFDDPGHSSVEDLERLEEMQARSFQARTIVWLPKFLSEEKLRELRRLVILSWLLEGSGDRWRSHADHLNESDRALARSILESQRNTLRRSVEDAVQQAYGAASPRPGTLRDIEGHDRTLVSLDRTFAPANPVGATLAAAFRNLLDQAFEATYPAHPAFEPGDVEVRVRDLKAVAAHVARAVADPDKRVDLQGDIPAVRRVTNPLGVGTASEQVYLLGDDRFSPWGQEIERALGRREQEGGDGPDAPVSVQELRGWIDAVQPPQGLRPEVADLVIITWAALRQRAWFQHGVALAQVPDPGSLQPAMQLRTQPMPTAPEWAQATALAGALLGVRAAYLTAPAVADFERSVVEKAAAYAAGAAGLVSALESAYQRAGLASGQRLTTARSSAELVAQLRHVKGVDLVRRLDPAGLAGTTPNAAGRSLHTAQDVTTALASFDWGRLDPLFTAMRGEGPAAQDAAAVVNTLRTALERDEFDQALAPALVAADRGIYEWLSAQIARAGPPPGNEGGPDKPVGPIEPGPTTQRRTRPGGSPSEPVLTEVKAFLDSNADRDVEVTWRVVP